jgi:hypothetical protein
VSLNYRVNNVTMIEYEPQEGITNPNHFYLSKSDFQDVSWESFLNEEKMEKEFVSMGCPDLIVCELPCWTTLGHPSALSICYLLIANFESGILIRGGATTLFVYFASTISYCLSKLLPAESLRENSPFQHD